MNIKWGRYDSKHRLRHALRGACGRRRQPALHYIRKVRRAARGSVHSCQRALGEIGWIPEAYVLVRYGPLSCGTRSGNRLVTHCQNGMESKFGGTGSSLQRFSQSFTFLISSNERRSCSMARMCCRSSRMLRPRLRSTVSVAGRRKGAGDGRRNGASGTGGKARVRTVSRLRFFAVFGNRILRWIGHGFGSAPAVAFEHEPVGAMT